MAIRADQTQLTRIVAEARPRGAIVKAILETCYYTPTQIRDASRLCADCGVDYIKTSTGFAPHGATPDAVQIMLDAVRGDYRCGVKASGGINTTLMPSVTWTWVAPASARPSSGIAPVKKQAVENPL